MSKTEQKNKTQSFMEWLQEDDSPQIGIASKEPLGDYFRGVESEFRKIEWPSKEQLKQEFAAVMVIVSIISVLVYLIDLGIGKLVSIFGQ